VVIRWTGLAPWEFAFPFPGSLTSTFRAIGRELPRTFGAVRRALPVRKARVGEGEDARLGLLEARPRLEARRLALRPHRHGQGPLRRGKEAQIVPGVGSYLRLIDLCIPNSRLESNKEEEEVSGVHEA